MTATSDTPTPIATDYARLADGFAGVLDAVPSDSWTAASPCPGWTAADVVGHVIDTQRDFLGRHDIDLGTAPDLGTPARAWREHADRVTELLADPAVGGREFDGHFGPTTVGDTVIRFYGFDMVAHRWDVAAAHGVDHRFTDDELAMMETAADGFGDALYSDGVCRSGVRVPDGADRQTRLLARLGRDAATVS
ncbi:maleylpyruvate isomerase family mycothiol-dependent enzyme [Gordonia soli]|uniref:Mycothiol-dependent maleylpyruvate isomerase metal-binding domain-containing protein n=1 Tax=Gordonia soli NBRC 108243 TaxID=1223545 RepID=M0QL33_9ACTN|nr:maleylpyruvate isomerase family mycothiol-dependent enzyme [Gordonia soli]GAC69268.1 hypothetical protein GS4_23_00650 [Gordonia soli NBRC 108243]